MASITDQDKASMLRWAEEAMIEIVKTMEGRFTRRKRIKMLLACRHYWACKKAVITAEKDWA